jgi:hypothetical protein
MENVDAHAWLDAVAGEQSKRLPGLRRKPHDFIFDEQTIRMDNTKLTQGCRASHVVKGMCQFFVSPAHEFVNLAISIMRGLAGVRGNVRNLTETPLAPPVQGNGVKAPKQLPLRFFQHHGVG